MDDLLDSAPCGFLHLSEEDTILQTNSTLREWLGYPADALPGKSVEAILPVSSRIFYQTYISPILKLQEKLEEIYISLRTKNGDEFPVLINAVRRQRTGAWSSEYIIVPMRKRNELESEMLRARREAEEANRKKDEALAALEKALTDLETQKSELQVMNVRLSQAMTETHHRVKNNLQLVSTLIDMQRDTERSEIPMEELERLGANVRALGVIHDILTKEAKAGSKLETLSVRTILDKLISTLQLTTGNRKLITVLDDAQVYGKKATALALVVNELVANALKHGTGDIEIAFTVSNENGTLEVRDDGSGFSEDFTVATRANIGLEIVGNIVTWDLGGNIEYRNQDSGGAHILVMFPIRSSVL